MTELFNRIDQGLYDWGRHDQGGDKRQHEKDPVRREERGDGHKNK